MTLRDYQVSFEGESPVNVADLTTFALGLVEDAIEHGGARNVGDNSACLEDMRERVAIERYIRARGLR